VDDDYYDDDYDDNNNNNNTDFQEVGCGEWAGLIWLRIGTGGGHL
jgi:hypothetical protein